MKDVLGQEILPGSKVLWGGGKTQYAGFAGGPLTVKRLTAKRVVVQIHSKYFDESFIAPSDVVVVDKILEAQ